MEFNKLERDILDWISGSTESKELRQQIENASLLGREYTKVGFFLDLSVPPNAPKIAEHLQDINPLPGPYIESDQLDFGGDSILFVNDGVIDTLEIFAYGTSFPKFLEKYVLKAPKKNNV